MSLYEDVLAQINHHEKLMMEYNQQMRMFEKAKQEGIALLTVSPQYAESIINAQETNIQNLSKVKDRVFTYLCDLYNYERELRKTVSNPIQNWLKK